MDERTLAAAVAQKAGLAKEEALDLARAMLEELGDQLSSGEIRQLTFALPEDLARHMRLHDHEARPMPLAEFVRLLSRRTGLKEDEVKHGVQAILATLGRDIRFGRGIDPDRAEHRDFLAGIRVEQLGHGRAMQQPLPLGRSRLDDTRKVAFEPIGEVSRNLGLEPIVERAAGQDQHRCEPRPRRLIPRRRQNLPLPNDSLPASRR